MRTAVVICTYNRVETLVRAVSAVLHGTCAPDEIIVVDQSDDPEPVATALASHVQCERVTLLRDEERGLSRARNLGWRRARAELILFTDDDARVDARWLEELQRVFREWPEPVGVAGGRVVPEYEEREAGWHVPMRWEYLLPAYQREQPTGPYPPGEYPAGVSLAVRRGVLEGAGGFDERLGVKAGRPIQIYGEDTAIAMAAERQGLRVIYTPSAIVHHPVPRGRQTWRFLNRRLFSEGATYVFLAFLRGELPRSRLPWVLLRKHAKLARLLTLRWTWLDRVQREGELRYVLGEIYMLVRLGFGSDIDLDRCL